MNSVKHLQDVYFSQFTLTEKIKIMNLGRAAPDMCCSTLKRVKTS